MTDPQTPTPAPELREQVAEALMAWAERNNAPQYAAMRRPDTVRQNAYGRADAVLAVIEPELQQLREAVAELAQAIRLTREYVGADLLPAIDGWSWYDALRRWAPEYLPTDAEEPTDVAAPPQCSPACSEQHTYQPPCELAPARSDVGTEFVQQVDAIDDTALAAAEEAIEESGNETPGCDCGHDGMGTKWHPRDCAWREADEPAPCKGCGQPWHKRHQCGAQDPLREQYAAAIRKAAYRATGGSLDIATDAEDPVTDAVLAVRDTELQQLRDELEDQRAAKQTAAGAADRFRDVLCEALGHPDENPGDDVLVAELRARFGKTGPEPTAWRDRLVGYEAIRDQINAAALTDQPAARLLPGDRRTCCDARIGHLPTCNPAARDR